MNTLRNIEYCKEFSRERLKQFCQEISRISNVDQFCVVINGSYARLEAHPESDFDYIILTDPTITEGDTSNIKRKLDEVVGKVVGKGPSAGGAFAEALSTSSFSTTIGGNDDNNQDITRRILFLTEGRAVGNAKYHLDVRDRLINKYIRPTITNHQLGLFLLNDIIRYYRTICVDFEQKTAEQGKPWGIRNVKLVFSRKLLYFSGILIAAEMADKTYAAKKKIAEDLISLPPLERVKTVCNGNIQKALESYDYFLGQMKRPELRERLLAVTDARETHTEEFNDLKNMGKKFSDQLMAALHATYPSTHAIHRSLIM